MGQAGWGAAVKLVGVSIRPGPSTTKSRPEKPKKTPATRYPVNASLPGNTSWAKRVNATKATPKNAAALAVAKMVQGLLSRSALGRLKTGQSCQVSDVELHAKKSYANKSVTALITCHTACGWIGKRRLHK